MLLPEGAELPDGLLAAFWEYERALMANDLPALDALFAPGPDTLRGDAGGVLLGHDAISAFRKGRGGSPQRTILAVHVRPLGKDTALVVAVTAPLSGGRGQQTQLWQRDAAGWLVHAAHVSLPAPAITSTVWRTVGTPLVAPTGSGPLDGQTVAVKDLFALEGHAVGGGVPAYLAEQGPSARHAAAVRALLGAGAAVQGIAQTDEFAYSIAGRNPHYGTPPNPAVVGGIPGGSSSGPASAVAMGQASIGLATDTGGSIRVPASYQGLWGLRTTHGAVDPDGLLALAPSFDTVGWLTREPRVLRAAAAASLDGARQLPLSPRFAIAPAVVGRASPRVREAFGAAMEVFESSGLLTDLAEVELGDVDELFETFRTIQGAEAWETHGDWIDAHPGALGADIAARFAWASQLDPATVAAARVRRAAARTHIETALDGRILLLPSASSTAPSTTADAVQIEATRAATLRLTAIAGLAGFPALSAPVLSVAGDPVGLCLVGPRHSDLALIGVGELFAAAMR